MKFGLSLDARDPAALLSLARLAEETGFDSVWLTERHFSDGDGCPAPLVAAAAIAASTTTIRIGVIAALGLSHPLYTAEDTAVLDNISNGRVIFAAARPAAGEAAALGLSASTVDERFREALAVCLAAWSPLPIQYRGRHFQVPAGLPENVHAARFSHTSVTPKPAQPQLPVWVLAGDDETAQEAARLGLPIVAPGDATLDQIRRIFGLHRSLAGESPGRPVVLMRDLDVGDVDRCIDGIAAYRDDLGVSYLICRFAGQQPALARVVEVFGKAVIPEFRMFGFPPEMRSRALEEASP